LVDAINSGQVYKYITKPWDPNELKAVVQRAAETYELLKQRTEELRQAQAHCLLLDKITQAVGQSDSLDGSLQAIAHAFGESFITDGCVVQVVEGQALKAQGHSGNVLMALEQNPGVEVAISTQQMQIAVSEGGDANAPVHLVIPATFRNTVLAVLSLQWQSARSLQEYELTMLHQAVQQVGMALVSARSYEAVAA
jgi:hypothetical protein